MLRTPRELFDASQELLTQALDQEAEPPGDYVRRIAANDPELRAETLLQLRHVPLPEADSSTPEAAAAPVATAPWQEVLAALDDKVGLGGERFEPRGLLGEGGMGRVLAVYDRRLRRVVARKEPRVTAALRTSSEQELVGRFFEEAQITGQLDHPGVVPVYDLGLDAERRPCFLMRRISAQTARVVFAKARSHRDGWTRTQALEVVLKVCDTVAYAHSRGVLHRDLKPENVMVGAFGEVYVMDWGLAKLLPSAEAPASKADESSQLDVDSAALTHVGRQVGTAHYMSPEQAAGLPLDARSDVYAIGAMVYELLTGLRPYTDETTSASRDEVLQLVRSQPPRPVETVAKGVPGELAAIVQRAMARQRDDRYPSVTALAADLRAFLDRRVVQAYRTGPLVELSMWIRRNRPLAASLVAAVLLLCGGVFGVTSYAAEVGAWQRRDEVSRQQFKILEAEPVTNVQFDQLAELTSLVAQCEAFPNEVIDALRRDAFLGPRYHLPWGLQRRLDAVRELHALQQARGEAAWRRVQRELAEDRRFDGYRIEPDVDLVPLRRDAESGLQWFWHPPTGSEPHFGADGRIEWHEANGLVFVLLPPGEYLRGSDLPPDNAKPTPEESRRLAESWAKYAMADDNDTQPFRVTVRPFYLCVTELTQVHWLRITGDNPSSCAIGDRPHPHRPEQHITGLHPVESVDALSARRALSMFGLVLPSETQWEYAYRAGTTTRWFTGQDPHSLFDASTTPPRGFANIADGSRFDLESTRMLRNELAPYDDGYPVHAPIDAFAPNAFGLLGMAGNVFEWCEDVYDPMAHLLPPNDEPARHGNKPRFRTVRGGGWKSPAREASAADRWGRAEFLGTSDCGVRPAKAARWQ